MANGIFHDRVAVITGAGSGIGLEISRQLARQGAHVVLNDREESLALEGARSIQQEGGSCIPYPGDASDIPFIESMVAQAVKEFGKLDVAVANAGITLFGEFLEYAPEDFYQVMSVNLGGSFFLAQNAARQMKLQQSGGRILFMSSVTAHQAHKNLAAYSMSKAALEMLAKALVVELSLYGITVNALAPGATLTERTAKDAEYEKAWSKITPVGKPALPSDVAHAALFLLSPEAGHITGQSLVVDGGWTCVSPSPY